MFELSSWVQSLSRVWLFATPWILRQINFRKANICEESWALKNWCFWTVVLERTLESPLDGKEIQPVHPKGDQSWVFFGRTDAKAETPILWPPHTKNWLIGKDPDAGKDRRQEEKGMTGWDGWMASPTRWTWVWVSSWSWWWTGRPGVLQSMGLQRVRHNWVAVLNWTDESYPVTNQVFTLAKYQSPWVYFLIGTADLVIPALCSNYES